VEPDHVFPKIVRVRTAAGAERWCSVADLIPALVPSRVDTVQVQNEVADKILLRVGACAEIVA
jgi:hypothetical protein